ncbi:MAG: biotin transporter BioY [Methanobrevibacter boviskoreani]|uniref:biotin transporter BioY n=1 Tax=Methanobrevibacter boviskoreani TaxID=1348249 RepID=UPI0023A812EC|nr:biotin transporter BioY [Methanobrevibacter boviskoreani]MCI6930361.1 biotin transporter BioY [Methanobrevibacter boviskoreani]
MVNNTIESYYTIRSQVYNHVKNAGTYEKVGLAFLMACFTGIAAQIAIPLTWTPVPITLQTFAVLISGMLLGRKYGTLSQVLYLALGLVIPWYSGMTGGIATLLGTYCGYFIGFLVCAYFVGSISERYPQSRKFVGMTGTLLVANFLAIYIPGLIGLYLYFYLAQGTALTLTQVLVMGLVPFIIGDILKVLAGSAISQVFLPKDE